MNLNDCPQEATLLAALASGSLSGELACHLESCPICQDARLVWTHLHESDVAELDAGLPSPGLIWWRAQLSKQRVAARRSVAAIDVMQRIAVAVTIIAVIALAAWEAPKLSEVPLPLLAGSAATVILLLASLFVVLTIGRDSHGRTSPRGM